MNKTKKSKTWKDQKEEIISYYKGTHFFSTHDLGILNQKEDISDCEGWLKEHFSLQGEMHLVMKYSGL